MKRVLLSLLLVVTACNSSHQPTTTSAYPPVELDICYSALQVGFSWKLDDVVKNINDRSSKFKLVPIKELTCEYEIRFEVRTLKVNSFGITTHNSIVLNEETPSMWRKHAICHEIGHALMLDHSDRETCMNPQSEHERLDDTDLRDIETRLDYLIR